MSERAMAQLTNLRLGVPTAGKKKKERAKKEEKKADAVEAKRWSDYDAFWIHNNDLMYRDLLARFRDEHGVDVLRKKENIIPFLWQLVRFYYQNQYHEAGLTRKNGDHHKLWQLHNRLADGPSPGRQWHGNPPADAAEVDILMRDTFFEMAEFLYENYVLTDYPLGPYGVMGNKMGNMYGETPTRRSQREVVRIVNEPDTRILLKAITLVFDHWFPTKEADAHALRRYFPNNRIDTTGFLDRMRDYWTRLTAYYDWEVERRARIAREVQAAQAPPRLTLAPTPKSRAEYDRNVQAAKDREAREAAERLAEQQARDAKLSRERDEAAREQTRLEQEREDALARQLERTSLAGSSRDHAQQAPLSPASEAKRRSDEEKAREAKEQDIAEAKQRRKAQKAEQAAKDAAEAKEEDRRAEARDTAKRIAHGEGYSKRKGNRE